jgi:HAMP domain-containing protein
MVDGQQKTGMSIRLWVMGSLVALVMALSGAIAFVLYELDLRKHDYQILNLAGQMRVIATHMEQQGRELMGAGLLSSSSLDRDFSRFERDVSQQSALYEQIIVGFRDRTLPADLIGRDEPLRCNWDQQSTSQLDRSVAAWMQYRDRVRAAAGPDPLRPKTLAMAAAMAAFGGDLIRSTDDLANAFQSMMEGKLTLIRLSVLGMAIGTIAAVAGLVALLNRSVLGPLDEAVSAFGRVAAGDLGHQVPQARTRELGSMTRAFNHLSTRLHALFGLTDRIGRGADVDQTLAFIHEEFSRFLPVDWVGLLVAAPDGGRFLVERVHGGREPIALRDIRDPLLSAVVAGGVPHVVEAGGGYRHLPDGRGHAIGVGAAAGQRARGWGGAGGGGADRTGLWR